MVDIEYVISVHEDDLLFMGDINGYDAKRILVDSKSFVSRSLDIHEEEERWPQENGLPINRIHEKNHLRTRGYKLPYGINETWKPLGLTY